MILRVQSLHLGEPALGRICLHSQRVHQHIPSLDTAPRHPWRRTNQANMKTCSRVTAENNNGQGKSGWGNAREEKHQTIDELDRIWQMFLTLSGCIRTTEIHKCILNPSRGSRNTSSDEECRGCQTARSIDAGRDYGQSEIPIPDIQLQSKGKCNCKYEDLKKYSEKGKSPDYQILQKVH